MNNNTIEGRRAVAEALIAGTPLLRLYHANTAKDLGELLRMAKNNGVVVVPCDKTRLQKVAQTPNHQGVVATVAEVPYTDIDTIRAAARDRSEPLFLLALDCVQDEGNLGALIRTAECAGAHGVVVPKRRAAGLSPNVIKTSAGAALHLPIAQVPGIPAFLRDIKKSGVFVYGAAGEAAQSAFETDFGGDIVLVLGNEEEGLSRLTRELCDVLVSLPVKGNIGALNVAAAGAVLMYTILRSRIS